MDYLNFFRYVSGGRIASIIAATIFVVACWAFYSFSAENWPGKKSIGTMGSGTQSGAKLSRSQLLVKIKWAEPVYGRKMALGFTGDAVIAVKRGGVVSTEADFDGKQLVIKKIRFERQPTSASARIVDSGKNVRFVAARNPGPEFVEIEFANGCKARVCLFVPYEGVLSKGSYGKMKVESFLLGTYRNPQKSGVEKVRENSGVYAPPRHFLKITSDTEKLFFYPGVRLGELVVPDRKAGERHCDYVPVNYKLTEGLTVLRRAFAEQGLPEGSLKLLSVWRMPIHNYRIGSNTFSRHKYMDAIDFIIDADGDGQMDDLNNDKAIDRHDCLWIVALIEELQSRGLIPIGGVGAYTFKTGDYKATMHLDFRGHRATWAYYHTARGKKVEFAWNSLRFADYDRRQRERRKDLHNIPRNDLPPLNRPVSLMLDDGGVETKKYGSKR